MKIIDNEEKDAHWKFVLTEGLKGSLLGLGVSAGLYTYLRKRHPATYNNFSTSIKSALFAMPTIGIGAFFADEGSVHFDEKKYRSDYLSKQEREKLEKWDKLSLADKCFTKVNDNKYKIIIGAWGASLYGSWRIVNRDKYMTTAQKAVQARVYAQAVTVVLLLGTILLSMHEQELKKLQVPEKPEWQKIIEEQQAELKRD